MNNKIKGILSIICIVTAFAIFSYSGKSNEADSCCASKMSGVVYAQNPPDEPEEPGNPDHVEPTKECATNPKDPNQVGCKCAKYRKCDDREPISCKSYCWKNSCKCNHPPCT